MSKIKKNKLIKELEETLIKKGVEIDDISDVLKKIENNLKDKKYGLVWEEHTEEIEKELLTKFPILKEEKELRIHNTEEGLTNNFLIEGDNLESLTALKNMGKKVDVIYIDVPYNTLSDSNDFTYNDRRIDKEDSYRHSKWLSFIEKRIELAKDIMNEESVIMISIDDNELYTLKLLCDSVFGEFNFMSNIVWKKSNTVKNDKNNKISSQTEYILVYAKNVNKVNLKARPLGEDYIKKSYRYEDDVGLFRTVQLYKHKNPKTYKVISPTGVEWVKPWNCSEEGFKQLIEKDLVYWGKTGDGVPSKKVYLKDSKGRGQVSFIDGEEVGYTGNGTGQLLDVLGQSNKFVYPKPLGLMKYLIRMFKGDSVTFLDFFSGTGTLGQAVLEYNKENGTNHNFILATNNEKNICREVTYQRMNKVINGYTTPKGKEVEGIPANLTYLKTELKDKEDNLGEFGLDENLLKHSINVLKVMHNISTETELIEGVLYELEDSKTNTKYIIYNNFYIDEDELKKVNKSENNVIYVSEENLQDSNLSEFDEVRNLNDLIVYK